MWNVAKKLWKELKGYLEENSEKYDKITVCGHSLGAGVAILFSFISNHCLFLYYFIFIYLFIY